MEKMVQLLQTLKEELPSLDFGILPKQTPALLGYLQYYNLLTPVNRCHIGYFPFGAHRLAAHIFWPANPAPPLGTVFYLHGYTDHAVSASRLIQYLIQQNFVVATYDAVGHGLSDGIRGYIDDFKEYCHALETFIPICRPHLPKPYHLIGHSLGGAIAEDYLFRNGQSSVFDKVILLAPLIRLQGWFLIHLKYKVMSRLVKEVRREFKKSTHDEELLRFVKESDHLQLQTIPLKWVEAYSSWYQRAHSYRSNPTPIKMIQGNQDQTVDWRYNCQFIQQKFPLANITIIPGARHALFGEAQSYWQQIAIEISETLNGFCKIPSALS
ncbi:MAG: alpha/beta hydrolase [Gammaproteobacteria bacterium]|nr:alpha/beta hydrolase [Gammaproteobacteria bacterium]